MKLEEINNKTNEAFSFLVAALESGESEVLTQYLNAMARFHTYSFGNIILIARQKPTATRVAGIRTWNSLGRFVKRGEKGGGDFVEEYLRAGFVKRALGRKHLLHERRL